MVLRSQMHGDSASGKQIAPLSVLSPQFEKVLQHGLSAIFQNDGKGEVKSYVLQALHSNDEVSVVTSNELRDTVQPLMREWARSHLRIAHEYSGSVEDSEVDEATALTQYTTLNDPGPMYYQPTPASHRMLIDQDVQPERIHPTASLLAGLALPRGNYKATGRVWEVSSAFQIQDETSVVKTLMSCLYALQQNRLKPICKAWIKGICPQKQAKVPYRNKKREMEGKGVEVPGWWPADDECAFKEPDHIDRNQRMNLCLHLLRLRPTVQQLEEWNLTVGKSTPKQPVRAHEEGRWVAFLRELTPMDVIDEVNPRDPEKTRRLQQVASKMFEIATLEEEYKDGVHDGMTLIQPLHPTLLKTTHRSPVGKRSRQSSDESSAADDEESDAGEEATETVSKKARTTSNSQAIPKPTKPKPKRAPVVRPKRKSKTEVSSKSTVPMQLKNGRLEAKPRLHHKDNPTLSCSPEKLHTPNAPPHRVDSTASTPLNTSFSSAMSDMGVDSYPFFPPPPARPEVRAYSAPEVTQPNFDTMPETPVCSPADTMSFDSRRTALGQGTGGLSIDMPGAPHGFATPNMGHQQYFQHEQRHSVAGLPSNDTDQQYDRKHWPDFHPHNFSYDIQQQIMAPCQHQQAGFPFNYQPTPHWANHYHQHPPIHGDNDNPYHNMVLDPSHDLPPAGALPASVHRGFTGHASGVGDSACPPGGFAQYYPTMTM